eukprot:CAMPEP_0196808210 /NCGR_PEP_ID=MMETSP1362-20130617/8202_1 /TAXON_ID=163516 /ORGANISM="Leptocylindrus danicus, Strain CCMP1856" /LENGTH=350 /DNA_ID=CAMNT_0042182457 /DNA_START=130 /DNA_END=1182 /DNA_ORIENTATION=+
MAAQIFMACASTCLGLTLHDVSAMRQTIAQRRGLTRTACRTSGANSAYLNRRCNNFSISMQTDDDDDDDDECERQYQRVVEVSDRFDKKSCTMSRREALKYSSLAVACGSSLFTGPVKVEADITDSERGFKSGGYGKEEYSNAFTASRDTNISPKEAYDSINSRYVMEPVAIAKAENRIPRALDVGAGAGVSTQILWEQGYRSIDAVDWSASAWDRFVVEDAGGYSPPSVTFYELDDERFRSLWRRDKLERYDSIVFNFAVNDSKAREFAAEMLNTNGHLLAPVNMQQDYWLKQAYKCYDKDGNILWQTTDVGAWSVQFQPDVTQDTCQGIWCAPFNGFKKMGTTSNSLW